jgi:mannose-6-phosphate isomerase-like protein (cupin superfamily)
VKPRDSQLLVSIRELSVWQGVDCLVGAVVLGVAASRLETAVGAGRALAFVGAVLLGVLSIYCFWLLLSIGAFWIVRLEFIVELFEGVYQAGRWPVGIYPVGLRVLLTFLVPLAFAVTVPAQAIAGLATGRTLLAAVAFTAALAVVTRWAWKQGLRHYSGSMSSGNAVKGRPGPAGDRQPWPNPTSRLRPRKPCATPRSAVPSGHVRWRRVAWPSWRLEMRKPVNLNEALASFDDVYSPRIVAHMNDYDVRVAHAKGEHVWHVHEETDEFFLVLDGRLDIAMRDAGGSETAVVLRTGDTFVVPRGIEHKPSSPGGAILMFEPTGTSTTGDRHEGEIPDHVDSTTGHDLT